MTNFNARVFAYRTEITRGIKMEGVQGTMREGTGYLVIV